MLTYARVLFISIPSHIVRHAEKTCRPFSDLAHFVSKY
jgi:hypothetical protein